MSKVYLQTSLIGVLTAADKNLVGTVFVTKLWRVALPGFLSEVSRVPHPKRMMITPYEFNGDVLVVEQIGTLENNTKGALADLLAHTVVDAHYVG